MIIRFVVLFDKFKNLWFSLPHLLQALKYSTYRDEIKSINKIIDNEDISTYSKLLYSNKKNVNNQEKIHPHTKMISEGGLYLLLNKSKKPLAVELKRELYTKILPDIRKYGKFEVSKNDKEELNKMNKKLLNKSKTIKNLKLELQRSKPNNYTNKTGKGFIYVLEIDTIYDGKNKKCYKIGYTSDLNKRISTYKTGHPDIKLVHQKNLKCNKKQLEKCILNLNILKLLKNKTEIICDVPLKKIIDEINDCKQLLEKYILNNS